MKQQYNEKAKQRRLVSEHFVFCSSFYDFSIVVIFFYSRVRLFCFDVIAIGK